MFISHKSNVLQHIHDTEWQCRRMSKGQNKSEYWAWLASVTTDGVVDYSGETGYTIVECRDEDVSTRLAQLQDYISNDPEKTIYNIKWSDDKKDSEIVDVPAHTIAAHKDEDGKDVAEKDVATTYVQTHFVGDDTAKDARILAEEWTDIRRERDRLLTNSDWTQGGDTPLASDKKTAWATYRTKLRDVPKDQKDKTTYASITWPSEPS